MAAGLIGDSVGEKRGEFGRGVPPSRFAEHLTGLGVEGGLRRQGDMTKVRADGHAYGSRRKCGRGQGGATFSHVGCGNGGAVCFLLRMISVWQHRNLRKLWPKCKKSFQQSSQGSTKDAEKCSAMQKRARDERFADKRD